MHKVCTKCGESQSTKEFSKRTRSSDGFNHWCKSCCAEYRKEYRLNNREKIKTDHKKWRDANRQYLNEHNRKWIAEWRKNNPDKVKEQNKLDYKRKTKTEDGRDRLRVLAAEWRRFNGDRLVHYSRLRQTAKLMRTPAWLTKDDKVLIQRKYTLAQKKTESTGEKWVVDHILPLKGKLVSGLHVPANLRVIKHTTNARKSNKFVPV